MPLLWYFFFREALLESVHEGKKPYTCYICDASFTQRPHMNTHIRNVHGENKLKHLPKYSWKLMLNNMKNMAGAVHEDTELPT